MRSRRPIVAALAAGLAVLFAVSPANAGPPAYPEAGECRYDARPPAGIRGNVLLITTNQSLGIRRTGSRVGVYRRDGLGSILPCEGRQATVRNIDRIVFRPRLHNHQLTIDESDGRFEPGASPERGGAEIEIVAVFPGNRQRASLRPGIRIWGTPGPDRMRIGRHRRDMTAINLAVGRDRGHKDPDVFAYAIRPAHYTLDGKDGNDQLGSSGRGAELDGPLPEGHVVLRAGPGADRVYAGPRRDHISGAEGDDRIYARGGDDRIGPGAGANRVVAGRGDDRISALRQESPDGGDELLSGGPGDDAISALNGEVESIGCGSGIDDLRIDVFDLWDRGTCEKPHGPGFP